MVEETFPAVFIILIVNMQFIDPLERACFQVQHIIVQAFVIYSTGCFVHFLNFTTLLKETGPKTSLSEGNVHNFLDVVILPSTN